jgi:DNA polymerase III subunit gamma/tau
MADYQPLFLKYRPQALADLIGQEAVAKTLTNAIEHDRIFHAYLFTGPRGTGKTSCARILAKSLNCVNGPTPTPCQVCASCEEIRRGISSSVFEIDAASNNSVDDARLLIERAPLVAQGGRYKIYIIDECHMLTKEAFNALLKTIEEPPPNVVFVLATTEEQKVLPTIMSRCQRLMFRLVNQNDLNAYLSKIAQKEKIEIEADALAFVARRSQGGLRDALGLLDQASLLGVPGEPVKIQDLLLLSGSLNEDIVLQIGEAILKRDGEAALSAVNQLLAEGREPYLIASELAKHYLNLAKASYITKGQDANERLWVSGSPEYVDRLIEQAANLDRGELSEMIESFDRLEQTCKRSSQPALNLEIGILSCCHRLDASELRDLKERVSNLEKEFNPALENAKPKKPEAAKLEKPTSAKASLVEPRAEPKVEPKIEPRVEPKIEPGFEPRKAEQIETAIAPSPQATLTIEAAATPVAELALEEPVPSVLLLDTSQEEAPSLNVTIDANQDSAPVEESVAADTDLDALWSDLLEELQKRNIPTFSLVSTHAFPVALSAQELTVGVLVEHFQKMIESKIEHIKAALFVVHGRSLAVRVRIGSQPKPEAPRKPAKAATAGRPEGPETTVPLGKIKEAEAASAKGAEPEQAEAAVTNSLRASLKNTTVHMVGEAYKLFEGPGSRLITST